MFDPPVDNAPVKEDHYKKDETEWFKEPCNTCVHRLEDLVMVAPCLKCSHYKD